tara:strand:- start:421 stop:744 length:324 start_codon:yes stop_codon:yes gene_type:complete
MTILHQDVLREIGILQLELQAAGLWSDISPSEDAFLSNEPFCYDQMGLAEWLQWIFIPRLSYLVEIEGQLPRKSSIHPMAEEAFVHLEGNIKGLMGSIKRLDALFTE